MTTLEIALLQWHTINKRIFKTLETISDENFHKQIVVNGNSPSWLFGHLADTDDKLLELLGIQNRIFQELKSIYHHERGNNLVGHLTKEELLKRWTTIIESLDKAFATMTEENWLGRHMEVTEDDFKKEPHRNKLNVLLSRVMHKASHLGQIGMLPK